ncbi:AAA family ATPase, partial [bacterium]|nr:AAA family ATPase [bacterium]
MNKFIIKDILIENSTKDIAKGEKYSFSEGINFICGNNEAGKSSLMKFIKDGFFLEKGEDSGKIYFDIIRDNNKTSYRADIKLSAGKDGRCKIFDTASNPVPYSVIEQAINRKYFEQGFYINLDDLNLVKNNDVSLI